MSSGEFGSLISEITGAPQSSKALASRPRQDGATRSPIARAQSPLKRKPEDIVNGHVAKMVKPNAQDALPNKASRPGSSGGSLSRPQGSTDCKASNDAAAKPKLQVPKLGQSNQVAKPGTPTTPKAPPKGSYRDMMARARAAQANQAAPPAAAQPPPAKSSISKIGRRKQERMDARKKAREEAKDGKDPKAATLKPGAESSKSASGKNGKKQVAEVAVKKKKERAPLEYKGTMRGAGPSSAKTVETKATRNAGYSSASGSEKDASSGGRRYTYASYSDEDEEEEEEDDDGSSDMEGGGFDALEAEEEASLRAARKEDLEALREEESHRREKLDRKTRLQQLAAKAKPPRY